MPNLVTHLAEGVRHQQSGQFDLAEPVYRQVLASHPNHPEALHYLGLLLFQRGQVQEALGPMLRAVALAPATPHFHSNLVPVLRAAGRLEQALEHARRAVELAPGQADGHHNFATTLAALGRHAEAAAALERVLELRPDRAMEILPPLARALALSGRVDRAIAHLQRAVAGAPGQALLHAELAILYARQRRFDLGLIAGQKALALNPSLAAAHLALGLCQAGQGRHEEAASSFTQATTLEPALAEAHCNLAAARAALDQLEPALEAARRAIELCPTMADAHLNLGHVHLRCGRSAEALAAFGWALELRPGDAEAMEGMGLAHHQANQLAETIQWYDRAIAARPSQAETYWNRALAILTSGDFARGWPEYEWRFQLPQFRPPRRPDKPRWDGTYLAGRTILIVAEQGFGDAIQFVRYAPLVEQRSGGKVLLECPPELARLFQSAAGVMRVIPRGQAQAEQPPGSFDVHVPMLSLPLLLETDASSIPAEAPYLWALPSRVEQWRARLAEAVGPDLKVGLVWAGSKVHKNDATRSCGLAALARLGEVSGVRYFGLQKGEATAPAGGALNLVDLSPDLGDFADTAAAIAALDLVISVDTAVAHLAGALGRPVWNLLAFAADWRWLLDRSDTPWYPTMRLFRQRVPGDWECVIAEVARGLRERVEQTGGTA